MGGRQAADASDSEDEVRLSGVTAAAELARPASISPNAASARCVYSVYIHTLYVEETVRCPANPMGTEKDDHCPNQRPSVNQPLSTPSRSLVGHRMT